jgi:hypothetical protein
MLKMGWTPLQVTDRHGKLIKNILIAIWSGDQSSKQEQCSRTPSRMAVPTAPTHALIPCSSHSISYEWARFSSGKLARYVNGRGVYVCSHLRAQAMTRPIRAAHLFGFPRGGRKYHNLKQRP